jgi:hypothetical protein
MAPCMMHDDPMASIDLHCLSRRVAVRFLAIACVASMASAAAAAPPTSPDSAPETPEVAQARELIDSYYGQRDRRRDAAALLKRA